MSLGEKMETFITEVFMVCVYVLQFIGGAPGEFGFGYYLANIVIFVIIQPGLIFLFFLLWRKERHLNTKQFSKKISYIYDEDYPREFIFNKKKTRLTRIADHNPEYR